VTDKMEKQLFYHDDILLWRYFIGKTWRDCLFFIYQLKWVSKYCRL